MAKRQKKPEPTPPNPALRMWIPKPKAVRPIVKDGEFGEYDFEGESVHWSGATRLPAVGSEVSVWFQSLGSTKVKGYFIDRGWLGLIVQKPDSKDDEYCFVMGSELGVLGVAGDPVPVPRRKVKPARKVKAARKLKAVRKMKHVR
jgi:hypothetical protein